MEDKKVFNVQPMDKAFIDRHPDTYEQYVLVHSTAFAKIFGKREPGEKETQEQLDGLVKVCSSCGENGKVYRRLHGLRMQGFDGSSIQIASRTMNYLGIKDGAKVTVSKACGVAYLWHHPDTTVRIAFRFAIYAFAFSCLFTAVMSLIH